MHSNKNRVLYLILLGLAVLLLYGLAGCTKCTDTKATQELGEAKEQREGREKTVRLEEEIAELSVRLEEEIAELRERVARLQRGNETLQEKVKLMVTLFKEEVPWCRFPPDLPAIEAVVQKVDIELKFVMLSVGSDDKVRRGMRFHISRDGSYVGEVRVDVVYPKSCSASFVALKPGMKIQVGDTAATRL